MPLLTQVTKNVVPQNSLHWTGDSASFYVFFPCLSARTGNFEFFLLPNFVYDFQPAHLLQRG